MGSRARGESGLSSDVEFGIILPDSVNIKVFKATMPDKGEVIKAIRPVELDSSHQPWDGYMGTIDMLHILFSSTPDNIRRYIFTDTRSIAGHADLLQTLRQQCHTQLLPLPFFQFWSENLLQQINCMAIPGIDHGRYVDNLKILYTSTHLLVRQLYYDRPAAGGEISSAECLRCIDSIAARDLEKLITLLVQLRRSHERSTAAELNLMRELLRSIGKSP
eukprot:gene23210-30425_t